MSATLPKLVRCRGPVCSAPRREPGHRSTAMVHTVAARADIRRRVVDHPRRSRAAVRRPQARPRPTVGNVPGSALGASFRGPQAVRVLPDTGARRHGRDVHRAPPRGWLQCRRCARQPRVGTIRTQLLGARARSTRERVCSSVVRRRPSGTAGACISRYLTARSNSSAFHRQEMPEVREKRFDLSGPQLCPLTDECVLYR